LDGRNEAKNEVNQDVRFRVKYQYVTRSRCPAAAAAAAAAAHGHGTLHPSSRAAGAHRLCVYAIGAMLAAAAEPLANGDM